MRRRVVVTGMGMVTPVGADLESSWKALLAGTSGVGHITHFDARSFPTQIAAELKGFRLADYLPDAEEWTEHSRNTQFALAAAKMALEDAGIAWGRGIDSTRFGVYLGSGEGQQDFPRFVKLIHRTSRDTNRVDTATFVKDGHQVLNLLNEAEQEPGTPAGHLGAYFGAQGPNYSCLTACAASAQAIGEAVDLIRRGDADVMLSGGTHSMIHPFGVTGFNLLTALSKRNDDPERASRPFDRDRDGFIIGEGAGMLILEDLDHAKARGATILGEILGYGSTADAFRLTDSHEEGRGAIACMREALEDAEVGAEDIDYINAHGTSTEINDRIETFSIKKVFDDGAFSIPVSSTKSMMGHLIAATGSVEAIACLLAVRDGVVPPTMNLDEPSPDCDLDYVPNEARAVPVKLALSNSFGFGGQNISLILGGFRG